MKYLITLTIFLGGLFISCEKDLPEPIFINKTTIDTIRVLDGLETEFPIEDSDSNIHTIDTFSEWGCDTFSLSPLMNTTETLWKGGQKTTVGIFAWEINYLVVCEDGIEVKSSEFFLYKRSGVGELTDYSYDIIDSSSNFSIDTISLSDVYGNPNYNNNKSVLVFCSNTTKPFNIKIRSITLTKKQIN